MLNTSLRLLCLLCQVLFFSFLAPSLDTPHVPRVANQQAIAHEAGHAVVMWHYPWFLVLSIEVSDSPYDPYVGIVHRYLFNRHSANGLWRDCVATAAGEQARALYGQGRGCASDCSDLDDQADAIAELRALHADGHDIAPPWPNTLAADASPADMQKACATEAKRLVVKHETEIKRLMTALNQRPHYTISGLWLILGPPDRAER